MPVYSELLTPSRSHARRGLYWTPHPADHGCPCDGTLEVTKGRASTKYALTEFPAGRGYGAGRAFELAKDDGTAYHLFLADDRAASTCDCPGHTYATAAKADRAHANTFETLGCCHLGAVASLVWNGWLPHPAARAEQDVGR